MRIKYTLKHINASTLMHPRCSARGDLLESMNHCNAAGGNSSAVIWYLDMLPIYDAQRVHFTQLNQSEFSKQTSEIARKRTNLQYPLLVADAAPTNREGWIEALVKHILIVSPCNNIHLFRESRQLQMRCKSTAN